MMVLGLVLFSNLVLLTQGRSFPLGLSQIRELENYEEPFVPINKGKVIDISDSTTKLPEIEHEKMTIEDKIHISPTKESVELPLSPETKNQLLPEEIMVEPAVSNELIQDSSVILGLQEVVGSPSNDSKEIVGQKDDMTIEQKVLVDPSNEVVVLPLSPKTKNKILTKVAPLKKIWLVPTTLEEMVLEHTEILVNDEPVSSISYDGNVTNHLYNPFQPRMRWGIFTWIENAVDTVSTGVYNAGETYTNALSDSMQTVGKFMIKTGGQVKNTAENVGNFIVETGETVVLEVKNTAEKVGEFVVKTGETVAVGINKFEEDVSEIVVESGNAVVVDKGEIFVVRSKVPVVLIGNTAGKQVHGIKNIAQVTGKIKDSSEYRKAEDLLKIVETVSKGKA